MRLKVECLVAILLAKSIPQTDSKLLNIKRPQREISSSMYH